ncbi:MAG: branched-chain amino acid ABC transporter permease, partial [Clostridiales bacterium]|nr:branched-chain amino acid ABC transporter permease [Clostridiales bacterium]
MKKTVKFAFQQTIPIMLGYLFLGTAFGLVLQEAGYSFIWAIIASVFIYAGSMQFVLVSLLTGGVNLIYCAVMTLFINGRHIFYGLSFIEKFKKMGKVYPYMIFSLTDETYSVLCSLKVPQGIDEKRAMFLIALFDQLYWISGSLIGALVGKYIAFNSEGVDFAMTALFVVIFIEQWKGTKNHVPAICGLLSAIVFLIVLGPDHFILPSLLF